MARTLPTTPIDDDGLGPAMRALTPLQRAFVRAKVELGLNDTTAYAAAGFAPDGAHAHRLAHDERIQAAILEEGRKLMRSEGARSILALVKIRDNPQAEDKDRIKCAVELLNRSGFHAVSEHHDHQHVHLSDAEQDRRILALCAELGLSPDDARKMLVAPADFERNAEGVYELAPPAPLSDDVLAVYKRETRARRSNMTPEELAADKARVRAEQSERGKAIFAEHQAAKQIDLEDYIAELPSDEDDETGDPFSNVEY